MNTSGITSGGKQFIINSKKYKQIDTIGEGAQGAVYKVVDLLTGKQFALKIVLRTRYAQLNKMIDQQISIMRKLSQLNCPCIIKLVDQEITKEYNMLVMELGEYSLSSYKEIFQTTLTDKETITLIKDILLALKTVHQINIIHRDIKPQNIIVNTLDSKHPYKLTDFGVSAGNNARKCTYIGTQPYMAPEVMLSKNQDNFYSQIADIWSFALVVFEAFFGFNPFVLSKKTRFEEQISLIDELSTNGFKFDKLLVVLQESKLHHLSSDLRKKYNEAPKEILDFIVRGLHKDPEKRIKLIQIQKIFQNTDYVPVPLLSKDEMKINMTKAKISIVQKNDSPLGMAKSSNVIGQPLLKKPSSLNQTYTGASNNQSFSNNANLFNTKTSSVEHTPYVLSSGYKADDKSHYSAQQTVGKMSGQISMMTPVIKGKTKQSQNQTKTMVKIQSSPQNAIKNNQGVWKTFGGTSSKAINNELSKFIQSIRVKLAYMHHAVKQLQNNEFSDLLKKIDTFLNSQQYDQNPQCKIAVSEAYHKLYKIFDQNLKFLQDKKMTREYIIQFLYQLIILANLSQITKHTLNAVRGLPQSVIKLANDPFNYFKYPCNYEMLKQFEWRFFCKAS